MKQIVHDYAFGDSVDAMLKGPLELVETKVEIRSVDGVKTEHVSRFFDTPAGVLKRKEHLAALAWLDELKFVGPAGVPGARGRRQCLRWVISGPGLKDRLGARA